MFTGLVEEIGEITSIKSTDYGKSFTVKADKIFDDLKLGDSVAINGACQTVTAIKNNTFAFSTVNETLKKTTFNFFSIGSKLNLERALRLNDRLGGHIMQGHIDVCGRILQINKKQKSAEIIISFPEEYRKYLAKTGSICIDGVSLTTAEIFDQSFKLAIIPLSLTQTIIHTYKIGNIVNLEFDILGKYIENMIKYQNTDSILSKFISQP